MPENPPEGMPRISPYLLYENVEAALRWLERAFGFSEKTRIEMPEGGIGHAEMTLEGGLVMMGFPGPDYRNPKNSGAGSANVYVYVNDVDAHHARAREAGAEVFEEPMDTFYGDRRYGVMDLEGHMWFFATHVRDVAPEDMHP